MREAGILYCNCCGKKIPEGYSRETEDFFHFEKTWGYFSGKDGTRQLISNLTLSGFWIKDK